MPNIKCIDVSEWQGTIDWKKVKESGIEFAILRAGFGRESSQIDDEFERNYNNAKKAGIKLGAYWYSYADSVADAEREAKACLTVLKGKTFELPIYYDLEDKSQLNFSKKTLTAIAIMFCNTVKAKGFNVGVYASLNWFTNYLDYEVLKKHYSIWLAQYYNTNQLDCDIWQHTSEGTVKGILNAVDLNVIFNTKIINILGDVNNDGKINIKDATLIQKHTAKATKLSKEQIKKADVNKDGKVNIKDATALQKQIAKK